MLEKKANTGPEKDEGEEDSCTKKVKAHSNNEKAMKMPDMYKLMLNKTVKKEENVDIQRW